MSLSKSQRASVFAMFGGKCAYCGNDLGARWHADHVDPIVRRSVYVRDDNGKIVVKNGRFKSKVIGMWNPENDRDDNYFPACIPCNIHKSSCTLEEWRRILQGLTAAAMRDYTPVRHAHRFGLVSFSDAPIVFYFEKLSTPLPKEEKDDRS